MSPPATISYTTLKNPLYIAEKPDMGAKIAKNLPGPHVRKDGYIETGAGVVTWAIGHLLQQSDPDTYDAKYEKWVYQDLPILPQNWSVEVSKSKSKQVQTIKNLLKNCSDVVNAGDPGREGQLIVDELLEYFKNKKPVWRLLLNSLDPATVKKALNNLEDNTQFTALYQAALARQRADWLVGMNMTRAYTLLGRQFGYQGVLSVGRVQTPTLAIVVRREDEINNFIPQTFWTLHCQFNSSPSFSGKYIAPAEYRQGTQPKPDWLDDTFRVAKESKAQEILAQVPKGTVAKVVAYQNTPAQEAQPLPFELSDLQKRMNSKHGAAVDDVLKACQTLYEHGYASYPRTDCCYLPTNQHGEAGNVLSAIAKTYPDLQGLVQKTDRSIVSPAWNDDKLGEHHGIIPTAVPANLDELSPLERHIYQEISLRFIAQFLPACDVEKAQIEMEAGGHRWQANGRVIINPGWRIVYGNDSDDDDDENNKDKDNDDSKTLPRLKIGDTYAVEQAGSKKQETKPPSRFTQGSLLDIMKHVDRLVTDPQEKKMLKSVKGIGRAATRDKIIITLLERDYLEIKKKQLHPTEKAKVLVKAIDKDLTDPGLTARWEQGLDSIANGKVALSLFQSKQEQWITLLIQKAAQNGMPTSSQGPTSTPAMKYNSAPQGVKKSYSPQKKSNTNASGGASAGTGVWSGPVPTTCPKCKKPMVQRSIKQGPKAGGIFYGCSGFPQCNHTEWPK